jgi:CheY-like chemotaxis protein
MEDDAAEALSVSHMLREEGYAVARAANEREALK